MEASYQLRKLLRNLVVVPVVKIKTVRKKTKNLRSLNNNNTLLAYTDSQAVQSVSQRKAIK